jgi:hypothetical protein
MSFTLTGGSILTKPTKLTATTATVLYGGSGTKRTVIVSVIAVEVAGATPTLTLDLFDGTTAYRLRNALAMTARQTFIFNEPIVLPVNWSLRATASAADQIECFVTFMSPDATALGN